MSGRTWAAIRAQWRRDPAFMAAYRAEYPFERDANRLMRQRAALGLTDREYADHLAVSLRLLRRWESGKVAVPADVLEGTK